MKAYADYKFYVEEFGGKKIKGEDFTAASLHATQYIKHITLGRSDSYTGDELKYATCAVADAYQSVFGKTEAEKKSENTDGYSVSYVVQGKDGESPEELFKRRAYESAKYWLANTGLLNRKVGCGHAHKCGLYSI